MTTSAPENEWPAEQEWLTVPELCERLDLTPSRVRRLFEELSLAAVRIDSVLKTPVEFLDEEGPLNGLRGTLVLLHDCGFSNDEAVRWLITGSELLGGDRPVDALHAGRKSEVRRVAQSLGY